jgi:2-oxoglutarate ferredoxin oxidoreductase subunit gamma
MKAKFRLAGRGGQGIKFAAISLAQAAICARYHTSVTVDYTPSVRGGPIFCDVVISSEPISYPFCDKDANVLLMLDQTVAPRIGEGLCHKTVCIVDAHTVADPEEFITSGLLYRCPFSEQADKESIAAAANIVSLGWLSKYIRQNAANGELPNLADVHHRQVIDKMPERFRETNSRAFRLGKMLFDKAPVIPV